MKNCKFCDNEHENPKDFCSEKCMYQFQIMQLQNDKVELSDKLRLLNSLRTGNYPNPELTSEANVLTARLECQKRIDEMTPDILYLYQQMMFAILEQCHLATSKLNISKDVAKSHNQKLKEVELTRDKQSLPREKSLRDKELWCRSWLIQNPGKSKDESETAWKQSQMKEKAIEAFMKIPGMTRQQAELMARQVN